MTGQEVPLSGLSVSELRGEAGLERQRRRDRDRDRFIICGVSVERQSEDPDL